MPQLTKNSCCLCNNIFMNLIIFTFCITSAATSSPFSDGNFDSQRTISNASLFQFIYWQVKPFIYKDDDGQMKGAIPDVFRLTTWFCDVNKYYPNAISYVTAVGEMSDLLKMLHDTFMPYGQGILENVTYKNAVWMPYMFDMDTGSLDMLKRRNLTKWNLFSTHYLVVITNTDHIQLHTLLAGGLANCAVSAIIVTIPLLIVIFLFWLSERCSNEKVSGWFISGIFTSLWLAVVTFSTVGFGDTIPQSFKSRMLMSIWMSFGLIMTAVFTATVTDAIGSEELTSIYNKRIAVINNSHEAFVITKSYSTDVLLTKSNKEAIDQLRAGNAFAAILNYDIASWYSDYILNVLHTEKLVMVKTLPVTIPVNVLLNENEWHQDFRRCMKRHWPEAVEYVRAQYEKKIEIEIFRYPSNKDLMENVPVRVLFVVTAVAVLCGLFYEAASHFLSLRRRKTFVLNSKDPTPSILDLGQLTQLERSP